MTIWICCLLVNLALWYCSILYNVRTSSVPKPSTIITIFRLFRRKRNSIHHLILPLVLQGAIVDPAGVVQLISVSSLRLVCDDLFCFRENDKEKETDRQLMSLCCCDLTRTSGHRFKHCTEKIRRSARRWVLVISSNVCYFSFSSI